MDEISYVHLDVWDSPSGEWFNVGEYRNRDEAVEDAKKRELVRYRVTEIRESIFYCDGNL